MFDAHQASGDEGFWMFQGRFLHKEAEPERTRLSRNQDLDNNGIFVFTAEVSKVGTGQMGGQELRPSLHCGTQLAKGGELLQAPVLLGAGPWLPTSLCRGLCWCFSLAVFLTGRQRRGHLLPF